jgi:hypothetical protein
MQRFHRFLLVKNSFQIKPWLEQFLSAKFKKQWRLIRATQKAFNPFEMAQRQLDEAAELLQLDPAVHELLRWPLRELHVTLPVKMDDGGTKIFHGFRIQYNDARGPNKGGIRFHSGETVDTVRALAAWMTWKTAVVDSLSVAAKVASSAIRSRSRLANWSASAAPTSVRWDVSSAWRRMSRLRMCTPLRRSWPGWRMNSLSCKVITNLA